jgi:threonine dehydrogenase-like Zn-dependent dehydrogenase
MRALTVLPGQAGSARLDDGLEPASDDGSILVGTLAVGVCGTDAEILQGHYGTAPAGRERLVLGHESLGCVLEAPAGSGWQAGLSTGGAELKVDMTALNRTMVLENNVVLGTVNANRRHYETAAQALAQADVRWLEPLITRRVPLELWEDAMQHQPLDVKTVIDFTLG